MEDWDKRRAAGCTQCYVTIHIEIWTSFRKKKKRNLDLTKHMSHFKRKVATKTNVGINMYIRFEEEKKNHCNTTSRWDQSSLRMGADPMSHCAMPGRMLNYGVVLGLWSTGPAFGTNCNPLYGVAWSGFDQMHRFFFASVLVPHCKMEFCFCLHYTLLTRTVLGA